RDCGRGRARRLGELLDVAESLPPREEVPLVGRGHAFGRVRESFQLRESERDRVRVAGELLVAAPRRDEVAPREAGLAPTCELLATAERIEHVELERRLGEPPLLELSRHRNEPLSCGRDVLARDGAAPCVRARATVAEDAAREDEAG